MIHEIDGPSYATGAPVLIIADDAAAASAAHDAVSLTGARTAGCITWQRAVERLEQQGTLGALMIEAAAVATSTIDDILPRLGALAGESTAPVAIAFDEYQIDLIASHMLGSEATLLCTPSLSDRVAALAAALAPRTPTRVHDLGRETEAARQRRLNEELARIADTLARLSRDGGIQRSNVAERAGAYGLPPAGEPPPASADVIRTSIRARRLRDRIIPGGLFEDPAWDMLLDLTAAELERAEVSVSSLCIAAAVAPTTALRWIGKLTDAGLVERRPDPFDRRRAFMGLTEAGRVGMHRYLAAVREDGLPIA